MGKLVQGEWMGTDGDTQPTDTEMLDWLVGNNASVFNAVHKFYVYYIPEDISSEIGTDTPRQAIAAEIMKEANK